MAPSPQASVSACGGGGTGAEQNGTTVAWRIKVGRSEQQGRGGGLRHVCICAPQSPRPALKVLRISPADPENSGLGRANRCTYPIPAPTPIFTPPPRNPQTSRSARFPGIAPSAPRPSSRCTQRGAWPPRLSGDLGAPILFLSLSPRRPINQAASAFSQTSLMVAALCSCSRADKRGKWSKPAARQETTALCVLEQLWGAGGATVQGDVTPAGISKLRRWGTPRLHPPSRQGSLPPRARHGGGGASWGASQTLIRKSVLRLLQMGSRWLGLGLKG